MPLNLTLLVQLFRRAFRDDASAARANVQAAVSEQVASLEARLQDTIAAIGAVTELVQRAEAGDAAAQRQLFERTAAAMPPGPGVVPETSCCQLKRGNTFHGPIRSGYSSLPAMRYP